MRTSVAHAESDPGGAAPCRYQQRGYRCGETAKSCTRDARVDGEYIAQGGRRRMMSRAYRCTLGHMVEVRWTVPLEGRADG